MFLLSQLVAEQQTYRFHLFTKPHTFTLQKPLSMYTLISDVYLVQCIYCPLQCVLLMLPLLRYSHIITDTLSHT